MDFELYPAGRDDYPAFRNLMHLYLYDFSEYTGDDVDEQGMFVDEYLERYWVEPTRYPFLIRVGGKLAGFVLVRQLDDQPVGQLVTHSIAEFFVMKKYRRHKIGARVACEVFDRFPGRWNVSQEPLNLPAQAFWRRVIGEYTGNRYHEEVDSFIGGPMQVFENQK